MTRIIKKHQGSSGLSLFITRLDAMSFKLVIEALYINLRVMLIICLFLEFDKLLAFLMFPILKKIRAFFWFNETKILFCRVRSQENEVMEKCR